MGRDKEADRGEEDDREGSRRILETFETIDPSRV